MSGTNGRQQRRGLGRLTTMRDVVVRRASAAGRNSNQQAYFLLSAYSSEESRLRAYLDELHVKQRLTLQRLAVLERRIERLRRDIDRTDRDCDRARPPGGARSLSDITPGQWSQGRREIELPY
jgi:hypothetical protein